MADVPPANDLVSTGGMPPAQLLPILALVGVFRRCTLKVAYESPNGKVTPDYFAYNEGPVSLNEDRYDSNRVYVRDVNAPLGLPPNKVCVSKVALVRAFRIPGYTFRPGDYVRSRGVGAADLGEVTAGIELNDAGVKTVVVDWFGRPQQRCAISTLMKVSFEYVPHDEW